MAKIAEPIAVPTLIQTLLHDTDTVVRSSSAGALAKMGQQAVNALLDIIAAADSPGKTKGQASWALTMLGEETIELLYDAIESDSADVRCAVVSAIGNQEESLKDDDRAVAVLTAALSDVSPLVRTEAATALGRVATTAAIDRLVAALDDEDEDVKKAIALRLMKIGDRSAIEPLQAALSGEASESVCAVFQVALDRLSGPDESDG